MNSWIKKYAYGHVWSLTLMTVAAMIIALAINGIAIHQSFIAGGFAGLGLLLYYATDQLNPGLWLLLLHIPVFTLGLFMVSRRFFLYSLYCLLAIALFLQVVNVHLPIQDPLLAALTYGSLLGAGVGMSLRSFGSTGGLDIIGVILYQKLNVNIGQSSFGFNLCLFSLSFMFLETDLVLYSLISVFLTAVIADYFMSLFNQRKMVLIITAVPEVMVDLISSKLRRGSTYIYGRGSYSGKRKKIVLTVINNFQLKRLEELIYTQDTEAFVVIENTFNVLGRGFSKRMLF